MGIPDPSMSTMSGASIIHDLIGPIFDEAYFRHIDPEVVREITLIRAKAALSAAQSQVQALEQVVKVVDRAKVGPARA